MVEQMMKEFGLSQNRIEQIILVEHVGETECNPLGSKGFRLLKQEIAELGFSSIIPLTSNVFTDFKINKQPHF